MEYTYIDRIKQLKSEKKITNDQLSEMTGIPLGTLSKILAGISDSPKLSNIIARAPPLYQPQEPKALCRVRQDFCSPR